MAGRKRRFERDDVVQAAAGIAEEVGLEAVTMRGVAERLGVSMPALYKHVQSRDELLGLLGVSMLEDLDLPDGDLQWTEWLTLFARRLRGHLLIDPPLAGVAYVAAHGVMSVRVLERGVGVLASAGFRPFDALMVVGRLAQFTVARVYFEHLVAVEVAQGRTQLSVIRSQLHEIGLENLPYMNRLYEQTESVPDDWTPDLDAEFEWQLAALIAGVEDAHEGRTKLPDPFGRF